MRGIHTSSLKGQRKKKKECIERPMPMCVFSLQEPFGFGERCRCWLLMCDGDPLILSEEVNWTYYKKLHLQLQDNGRKDAERRAM
jgi:hypothetical protein